MSTLPLNIRTLNLPFRVGATSYVIEADLLPNAQFLAAYVQDMQLVLFAVPDGPSNLPDAATVAALAAVGRANDLTYTVHLLDDLAPHTAPQGQAALQKAQDVIQRTQALAPWAYVLHLEGRPVRTPDTPAERLAEWQTAIQAPLHQVIAWTGDATLLAVENLEGYPADFVTPAIAPTLVSRCVDIGHLWLDGHDPLPWLQEALPRTRVVHLHGLHEGRDHQSVAHMAPAQLDPVINLLIQQHYTGVITLEVFGEADFWSSLHALHASILRCRHAA